MNRGSIGDDRDEPGKTGAPPGKYKNVKYLRDELGVKERQRPARHREQPGWHREQPGRHRSSTGAHTDPDRATTTPR
ncbi:hypothetical protein DPMN_181862 [Dreissena polymorpha]|uniref:Uncharacterized protein n=1 Tax=Dreissena polymorpha TaxID=45954 RepID=A0A9D4DF80_DREPO|nr:hypothetical protein DPMN_181862 [Dreissena polymorpha]